MKTIKYASTLLAAAAISGAIALAPVAGAVNPVAPVASTSVAADPSQGGYVDSSHDEVNTTNGFVDRPF